MVGFIGELGLKAVKDKLTYIHNEKERRKDIEEFAARRFQATFENLDGEHEIDYAGLPAEVMMSSKNKVCIDCKREYPATNKFFNEFKRGHLGLSDVCTNCQSLREVCGNGPKIRRTRSKQHRL